MRNSFNKFLWKVKISGIFLKVWFDAFLKVASFCQCSGFRIFGCNKDIGVLVKPFLQRITVQCSLCILDIRFWRCQQRWRWTWTVATTRWTWPPWRAKSATIISSHLPQLQALSTWLLHSSGDWLPHYYHWHRKTVLLVFRDFPSNPHSQSFKDRQRQLCNQRKWCQLLDEYGLKWLKVDGSGWKWMKIFAVLHASLMPFVYL